MKRWLVVGEVLLLGIIVFAPLYLNFDVSKKVPATPSASVIFGGDMMFDRYIRQVSDTVSPDYPFSCIDQTLASADAVVANLEGPITDNAPSSAPLTFTFPPSSAATLARHHIQIVNIGNNHILNFGTEGLVRTKQYLTAAGVTFFDESNVATTSINGIAIAFINYNESGSILYSKVLENIRTYKARGFIPVVYTHWGEEYKDATEKEKSLAHQFINAGAEMVIGSHPHVVQEHELYQGKHIYYSLGNFIFDQYFSDAVMHGLLIKVQFSPTGVSGVEEIPIQLGTDGRTCRIGT